MKDDFIKLYDEVFDDIYRYVYFKTNNKWDTDDLVSEIFRKTYEKYDTSGKNKRAWLFSIAKNTITDHYRKKRDIVSDELIEGMESNVSYDDEIIRKEEFGCLKGALGELEEEEFEIINLRYFSEMKFKDIGVILDKSESALKMRSARIIKKLRELVDMCMEGS